MFERDALTADIQIIELVSAQKVTCANCRALNHFHQVRASHWLDRLLIIEAESLYSEPTNLINKAPAEQETCFQAVALNLRLETNERLA